MRIILIAHIAIFSFKTLYAGFQIQFCQLANWDQRPPHHDNVFL
ncbi:hypothetical protein [Brucella anthropi]